MERTGWAGGMKTTNLLGFNPDSNDRNRFSLKYVLHSANDEVIRINNESVVKLRLGVFFPKEKSANHDGEVKSKLERETFTKTIKK